ncbi:MAG: membrane protein insertion efficiency factor YidD [Acidobacteria bacterium]|nr:membrane protein insertion efficiency factor YidD [Acidobacteriota bacterium]
MPSSNAADASHHPHQHVGLVSAVILRLLRVYKILISPLFTGCCRYYPTCADYTREAVEVHGAGRGAWLGARRLSRCHPFGRHGVDPVPR